MANRNEFINNLDTEIKQAGRQRIRYSVAHNFLLFLTISSGATTTYLAGTGFENTLALAALAAFTTLVGTLEKTFSFGRAKSGFRKAKTQFEKLSNDLMKIHDNNIPDSYIDRLNEIKELKVELTDAS